MDEPEFFLWREYPKLREFRFVDIESSGLIMGSYPIQYGWCGFDLRPREVLIKPLPQWSEKYFIPESVKIHGIERAMLLAEGVEAVEVANIVNDALRGGIAFVDSPAWDTMWTDRMFGDTGIQRDFAIENVSKAFEYLAGIYDPWCVDHRLEIFDRVDVRYPHTHKADEDCLRLAATTRAFIDRHWSEWLLDR